jgi:hypothetical protein
MYARGLPFATHEYCAQFCVRGLFGCIIASRASEIGFNCTLRPIDGGSLHVFLANASMSPYFPVLTPSSVFLFIFDIFSFVYSVKQFVRCCSCSSLGMRLRNGLVGFMALKH